MATELFANVAARATAFQSEAHRILAGAESSTSRVVTLSETYTKLALLNVRQDALFRQALDCTTQGFYRAAHVLGWAAFMDFVQERMNLDGLAAVRREQPSWKAASLDELREHVAEFQQLEVSKKIGLLTKNTLKALHGLLNKRNESAHPGGSEPDLNETLGYLSELIRRADGLKGAVPT